MTISLYVGTDPQQHIAERALEASVRENTSVPVDITWMRQGDPGWDWGGIPAGWATPFSMFRFAVPEYARYKGRAIYMDVDMLALADLKELWEWPIPDDKCGMYAGRFSVKADVILWKCDRVPKWGKDLYEGRHAEVRSQAAQLLRGCALPPEWDHQDKLEPHTKILHYTKLSWQFWKPYPERFDYQGEYPDKAAEELFWHYANLGNHAHQG